MDYRSRWPDVRPKHGFAGDSTGPCLGSRAQRAASAGTRRRVSKRRTFSTRPSRASVIRPRPTSLRGHDGVPALAALHRQEVVGQEAVCDWPSEGYPSAEVETRSTRSLMIRTFPLRISPSDQSFGDYRRRAKLAVLVLSSASPRKSRDPVFRFLVPAALIIIATLLVRAPTAVAAGPDWTHLRNAGELVDRWSGGGLYVSGSVGVSNANLDALDGWLRQYPNWTVFLLERAEGVVYEARDGATYYHSRALEHMLSHELSARTTFGDIVDERTQLSYGAILYISFDRNATHRKLGYYGGDAFDRHGVGESRWRGGLDRAAIRALKNGRRVTQAVRDTVTEIETKLTAAIDRSDRERLGARDRVAESVRSSRTSFDLFHHELASVRERYSLVRADAIDPDLGVLIQPLRTAERALEELDLEAAEAARSEFESALAARRSLIDAFLADARRLDQFEAELIETVEAGLPAPVADRFREEFDTAKDAWSRGKLRSSDLDDLSERLTRSRRVPGEIVAFRQRWSAVQGRVDDPDLSKRLRVVKDRVDRFEREFDEGVLVSPNLLRDSSSAVDAIANQRVTRIVKKQQDLWSRVVAAIGVSIVIALGLLFGYRRVRNVRDRARKLFAEWDALLTEKTTSLWELEIKKDAVLGSTGEASRFDGETKTVAAAVRQSLGELFVMRSLARKQHESARPWLQPTGVSGRVCNFLLARNFERAIQRLSFERVVYDRESGLPEIMREAGSTPEIHVLAADLEDVRPFSSSFDELMDAFNDRAARCLVDLGSIESAARDIFGAMRELDALIKRAAELDSELSTLAESDRDWRLPSFADFVTRVLDRDARRANQESTRDPIRAVRIARGATQVAAEVQRLVGHAIAVGRERVPLLRDHERALVAPSTTVGDVLVDSIRVDWIGIELDAITTALNAWLGRVNSPGGETAPDLRGTISALEQRVSRVVDLDLSRRQHIPESIVAVTTALTTARHDLGGRLSLSPAEILIEGDPGPDRVLAKARVLHRNSAEAITVGELDRAERDLALAFEFAAKVQSTVDRTRRAYDDHDDRVAEAKARVAKLLDAIPEHERAVRELERDYAVEVLEPLPDEYQYPGANETLADNIDEVARVLSESGVNIDRAGRALRQGRILQSSAMLDSVFGQCDFVDCRFAEINDRRALVDAAEAAVESKLAKLEALHREQSVRSQEMRTTRATRSLADQCAIQLSKAKGLVLTVPRRLFSLVRELDAAIDSYERLGAAIDRDWSLHREARRSVQSVSRLVATCEREAQWAMTDGVPDSARTRQLCRRILEECAPELGMIRRELDVPHSNWLSVDTRANTLLSDATRLRASLAEETTHGKRAVEVVLAAHAMVRSMQSWSGSHGVTISGDPGGGLYRSARSALEAGEYSRAEDLAGRARTAADGAIRDANRRVERKRRMAQRAARAARRRRVRAAQAAAQRAHSALRSSSISGGFGGGSSSSGFSGSGFSSSSAGTSGSGFASSNW